MTTDDNPGTKSPALIKHVAAIAVFAVFACVGYLWLWPGLLVCVAVLWWKGLILEWRFRLIGSVFVIATMAPAVVYEAGRYFASVSCTDPVVTQLVRTVVAQIVEAPEIGPKLKLSGITRLSKDPTTCSVLVDFTSAGQNVGQYGVAPATFTITRGGFWDIFVEVIFDE